MAYKPTSPDERDTKITIIRVVGGVDVVIASNVWAKKTTHRSDEAIQAMAATGTATHNFRMPYNPAVRSKDIIKEGSRRMAIIGPPMPVEGRTMMDVTAKEAGG